MNHGLEPNEHPGALAVHGSGLGWKLAAEAEARLLLGVSFGAGQPILFAACAVATLRCHPESPRLAGSPNPPDPSPGSDAYSRSEITPN
jgi:hypothetical protein